MRTPSFRPSSRGTERMLIVRVALALGLALLLLIGAWSTSHRTADAHVGLCLAPGTSASAEHGHGSAGVSASVADAAPVDVGTVVIAALCCFLLVLVLRRLPVGGALLRSADARRTAAPPRAGPLRAVPALTLLQLSLSRT
jgi:hypothetical protein